MGKEIILMDGQNLFYHLRKLHLQGEKIQWRRYFAFLLQPGNELHKAYLFRPGKLQDRCCTPKSNVLSESWLLRRQGLFAEEENYFDSIGRKNPDIQIVKAGVLQVDSAMRQYVGEKGVDLALATKMISSGRQNSGGRILLMSGDYDYGEAIDLARTNGTKVHVVKIHEDPPEGIKTLPRAPVVIGDKEINLYASWIRSGFLWEERITVKH